MKTNRLSILIAALVYVVAACSPATQVPQEQADPPSSATIPVEPTSIPATDTPEPAEPEKSGGPTGILIAEQNSDVVLLVSLDGEVIDEQKYPGLTFGVQSENTFHFGGRIADGLIAAPSIYLSNQFEDPYIVYHQDKAVVPLRKIPQLINMVGSSGNSYVSYTFFDPQNLQAYQEARYQAPSDSGDQATSEPSYVYSWLFAGSPETLPDAEQIISKTDENGYVLYPLAVTVEDDQMVGVWYTLESRGMFGIGPIFFRGFSRLYYADLQTGLIDEVLGAGSGTLALSNDQTSAAYEQSGMNDQPIITIHNFVTGKINFIDVLQDTHPTGVGDTHFSPNDDYVAWREVSMGGEDLFSVIRIASASGGEMIEIDSRDIKAQITTQEIHTITLAGWLDDQNLLIEAHYGYDVDLYRLEINNSTLEFLATGSFLGFAYP